MSAYLYDEALIEYLRSIIDDERVHIINPNQAISFLAQFDKDKVKLPAVVVSRGPISITPELKNQVATFRGQTSRINSDNTATKAKSMPMSIEWNIDVIAADRYTCDEIIRELMFYLVSNPRLNVKIPYDLDIIQNFDLLLDPEIEDNTDLMEFPNTGEIFRETIGVSTENAHLYSSNHLYLTKAIVDIEDNTL